MEEINQLMLKVILVLVAGYIALVFAERNRG